MTRFRALESPELSQNQRENAQWSMGQYLLGALALFGTARYLPKLVRQVPALRERLSEGLVHLATRVTPTAAENFFEGLGTYAVRRSSIFSNMQWRQRIRNLPHEITNLQRSFTDAAAGASMRDRRRFFIEDAVENYTRMERSISDLGVHHGVADRVFQEWYTALQKESERRIKSSSLTDLVNLRHLTITEALTTHRSQVGLPDRAVEQFEGFQRSIGLNYGQEAVERFGQMPLDHRLYTNRDGSVVDFRGLMQIYSNTIDTLATDWQVPFVKINPFTILGFNQYKTLQNESFSRVFPIFSRGPSLYHLTRGKPEIGDSSAALSFVGGKMIEVTQSGKLFINDNWHLTTPGSQFGQHARRMLGRDVQIWDEKIPGSEWGQFARRFDLFRQEMEPENLDVLTVDTWWSAGINKAISKISPFRARLAWQGQDGVHERLPQWADPQFGPDALTREYRVAFRKSAFGLDNPDFSQLWRELKASPRTDPASVTTATMVGYTFAYKVNVALTQIGLGLSTESMGSTVDFFKNLMTKRVLPAMALFYTWRGVNETMDDASPASMANQGVQGWQNIVSGISDFMGLPDRLKRLGELMPGFDQIGEFPILPLPNNQGEISALTLADVLPLHLTPEELDEERKYGLTPIRRARYWSVGNSPYTGTDIIGYAPHWSRIGNVDGLNTYGPSARRGLSFGPLTDVPVVGGAFGGLSAGGSRGFTPQASTDGGGGYYAVDGPMGTFRLHGGSGTGKSIHGGNVGEEGEGVSELGAEIRGPVASIIRNPVDTANTFERMGGAAGRQISDIFGFAGFAIRTATGIDPQRSVGIWASGGIGNTLWHSQLGGFGGTVSEVIRRFFPPEQVDDSGDMTPSGMPSWMPGANSFKDFQHGYAYEKIPMGHYMLPGPKFAELNRIPEVDLSLEAGLLGASSSALDAWWSYNDPNRGGVDRRAAMNVMEQIKSEGRLEVKQGGRAVNAESQIFTDIPFFIQYGGQPVPAFVAGEEEGPGSATYRRAEFAAAQLGVQQSLIFTQSETGLKATTVSPDFDVLAQMTSRVDAQRSALREAIEAGRVNGMEFYHPAYRLLTLAAVSPHSEEYGRTSKLLSGMKLTPELDRVVKQAREIASDNKDRLRVYPYKFNQDLKTVTGRVSQVIDKNHILVEGIANPIRLAGIHVLPAEPGKQAEEYLRSVLQPGTAVEFQIGESESWKIGKEGQTLAAIVKAGSVNINHELMQQGLAEEDAGDDSPAAVFARYSPGQRMLGRAWEAFAHLPLISHTKFLQVKSPVEAYTDREIFGKAFQSWSNPVSDFLVPTFQSFARTGPLISALAGAAIGYKFGVKATGRLAFSLLGAAAGATTSAVIGAKQLFSGKSWTPERRQKQWHLEEYVDALKYVKAMRNFNLLAKKAKDEEDFDVAAYIAGLEDKSRKNRYTKNLLEAKKRKIREAEKNANAQSLAAELQIPGEYAKTGDLLKEVNRMLQGVSEDRGIQQIGPIAAQALSWYKESKQTLQGWEPGDSIADLIAALPAIDRKYFPELIESAPEELQKLEQVAPRYLTRALRLARGENGGNAESLSQIFAESGLPGPGWEGWRPDVSLGDARIKIIRREGLDAHGMGVYPQDIERAERSGIVNVPRVFDYGENPSAGEVENRLRAVLGSGAVEFELNIVPGGKGVQVELDHEQDRRDHIKQMLLAGGLDFSA